MDIRILILVDVHSLRTSKADIIMKLYECSGPAFWIHALVCVFPGGV